MYLPLNNITRCFSHRYSSQYDWYKWEIHLVTKVSDSKIGKCSHSAGTKNLTWLLFHEWSSSLPACSYKYSPVLTAADFITWLLLLCWLHDRRSCAVRITSQFFTSPLHNMCWRHNWFTEFTWCSQLKSCALCMNLLHVTWLKWHWILTIMNTVGHQILKSECSVQMKSALEKTNI